MRKGNNQNRGNMKHRGGQGGRRYQGGNGGGGNRGNDGQNIARQKHHATQMREKFSNMARDAQNNGDRVDVEYYLQHVDHYTRVLTDIAAIEAERFAHQREQQQPSQPQENSDSNEGQPADATAEAAGSEGGEQAQPTNQPRMTRQHHRRPQQQASDNGAAEANANTAEIPLPGSILPQI